MKQLLAIFTAYVGVVLYLSSPYTLTGLCLVSVSCIYLLIKILKDA